MAAAAVPISFTPAADSLPVAAAAQASPQPAQPNGSTYMFNAERFAKSAGCETPAATMNIKAITYETFTVRCSNVEAMSIRCDDGSTCRELK